MNFDFTTGLAEAEKRSSNPFAGMTLDQRRELVLETLNEVGATSIRDTGRKFIHSCVMPFGNHSSGDRNPSAWVSYDMMGGGCSVCGAGGWLWWIATVQGLESTAEARDWVASRVNETRVDSLSDLLKFLDDLQNPPPEIVREPPVYDPSVLKPWMLIHPYMTEHRHVPVETIVRLKVGYGKLRVRVGDKQFVTSERIIIPHFFDGKLMGWQSRRLMNDGTPKYLWTPDAPKDTTLFDFDRTRSEMIVVESPLSVLRHSHNAPLVATFGASVTDRQIELIASLGAKVILWFDNDKAGWNATELVGDALMARQIVWAVQNPYLGDPGDLNDEQLAQVMAEHVIPYALWRRPDPDTLIPFKEATDGHQEVWAGQDRSR